MANPWYRGVREGPEAAGAGITLVNNHGVRLPSVIQGNTFDVDPNSPATRGSVVLQQNGYTGWTVTRAPIQQPNGRYTVPLNKTVNGQVVYYENVVFDDLLHSRVGGRRRRTSRHRRRVRRTRRRHSRA